MTDQRRAVVVLTVPYDVAQRLDYLAERWGVSQDAAIHSAVAIMTGMTETGDERLIRFMEGVKRAQAVRSMEFGTRPLHRGA